MRVTTAFTSACLNRIRSDLKLRELQEAGHAPEPKETRGPEGYDLIFSQSTVRSRAGRDMRSEYW